MRHLVTTGFKPIDIGESEKCCVVSTRRMNWYLQEIIGVNSFRSGEVTALLNRNSAYYFAFTLHNIIVRICFCHMCRPEPFTPLGFLLTTIQFVLNMAVRYTASLSRRTIINFSKGAMADWCIMRGDLCLKTKLCNTRRLQV